MIPEEKYFDYMPIFNKINLYGERVEKSLATAGYHAHF